MGKEEYLLKKQQKEKEHLRRIRQTKMRKISIFALSIFLVLGGVFILLNYLPEKNQSGNAPEKPKITVFYSPTCACCKEYIPYLKRNGFEVAERPTRDMLSVKEQYQIPENMESCHTSVVGDYFIEGHIPTEVIKKLLEEKPEIDGIALPGMPAGSPGMEGFKIGKWTIYSLASGQSSEFLVY